VRLLGFEGGGALGLRDLDSSEYRRDLEEVGWWDGGNFMWV
jgi:hypothetical protein